MGGGSFLNRRGNGSLSVTLHREFYERKFVTDNICGWAFIFHVSVLFTLFVLPFVLTFSSGSKYNLLYHKISHFSILGKDSILLRAAISSI